jgi:type IX secretion system PorP/SprF family membrane protein
MKKIFISIAFLLSGYAVFAQQELQMSHYLFNGLFWNPGYTGSTEYVRFNAMYRHQWTNYSGAPRTAMFSADVPLRYDNMGIGFQATVDQVGVTTLTEFFATYAYQIRFTEKVALGVGIRAGVSNYRSNNTDLTVWDANDVHFDQNTRNLMMPKVGFGLYLHGERFYVGASVPTLWAYDSDHDLNININEASYLRRHYYFSAAYVFKLNENFNLKPSVFTKYVNKTPFQGDLSLTGSYKNFLFLTAGYRTNSAAIAMIEIRPIESLRIGYAFDLSTPDYLRMYGGTTHEIMLGYDILSKTAKYKTPRYF